MFGTGSLGDAGGWNVGEVQKVTGRAFKREFNLLWRRRGEDVIVAGVTVYAYD